MEMMKTPKYYIRKISSLLLSAAMVTSLTFTSCEEIIDLEPYNQISENVAFSTPSLVELSVLGMYNAAQIGFAVRGNEGTERGYPFGAAFVQQGDCRGEDAVNVTTFYGYTYQGTYSTVTENNVWYWSDTYRLINRCNIVIEGVKTAATNEIITSEKAIEYEAEARLLRGLAYNELLMHFAYPYKHTANASHWGVPIHTEPIVNQVTVDNGLTKGRAPVEEVYQQILEDLTFAENNLPTKDGRTGNSKLSRGTKGAAVAAKTRVYLHMWDMDKVITESSKFLTGGSLAGEYSLTAEPWEPFANPYSNTESIFGMENSATKNPGVNAALASMYKNRKLVAMSPIVWRNKFWLEDDKRRTEGVMVNSIHTSETYNGRVYTNKYSDDTYYTDPSPMIRYAEVILNLAEAYARKDDVANGLTYLNMVRDRSLADPATQSYTAASFASNVELLEAILAERRVELAMEGRRWPDIHRLQFCPHFPISGVPAKHANAIPSVESYELGTEYSGPYLVASIPYADYRFLWPIPQIEIDANPTLAEQQNPGW